MGILVRAELAVFNLGTRVYLKAICWYRPVFLLFLRVLAHLFTLSLSQFLSPTSGPSPPYAFGHDQGFAYHDTFCTFGWSADKNPEASGANGSNGIPLLSLGFELLYSLDTNTRQWKPPLNLVASEGALCPEPRLGFCLGLYENHVYVFGGQVDRSYRNDLWTLVSLLYALMIYIFPLPFSAL